VLQKLAAGAWSRPETLQPKWRFATEIMGISLDDILQTGAPYFRMSLDKEVAPRHFFLLKTQRRQGVPLKVILHTSEKQFCKGVGATVAEYKTYLADWRFSEEFRSIAWIQPDPDSKRFKSGLGALRSDGGRRNGGRWAPRRDRTPKQQRWQDKLLEEAGFPEFGHSQEQKPDNKVGVRLRNNVKDVDDFDEVQGEPREDEPFDDRYDDDEDVGGGQPFYDRYEDSSSDRGFGDDRGFQGGRRGRDSNDGFDEGRGFGRERQGYGREPARTGRSRGYDDRGFQGGRRGSRDDRDFGDDGGFDGDRYDGGFDEGRGFGRERQGYGREPARTERSRSYDDRGFQGGRRGSRDDRDFGDDGGFDGDRYDGGFDEGRGFGRERQSYGREPARTGRSRGYDDRGFQGGRRASRDDRDFDDDGGFDDNDYDGGFDEGRGFGREREGYGRGPARQVRPRSRGI